MRLGGLHHSCKSTLDVSNTFIENIIVFFSVRRDRLLVAVEMHVDRAVSMRSHSFLMSINQTTLAKHDFVFTLSRGLLGQPFVRKSLLGFSSPVLIGVAEIPTRSLLALVASLFVN